MSTAEAVVVKKRGRPRKVVAEAAAAEAVAADAALVGASSAKKTSRKTATSSQAPTTTITTTTAPKPTRVSKTTARTTASPAKLAPPAESTPAAAAKKPRAARKSTTSTRASKISTSGTSTSTRAASDCAPLGITAIDPAAASSPAVSAPDVAEVPQSADFTSVPSPSPAATIPTTHSAAAARAISNSSTPLIALQTPAAPSPAVAAAVPEPRPSASATPATAEAAATTCEILNAPAAALSTGPANAAPLLTASIEGVVRDPAVHLTSAPATNLVATILAAADASAPPQPSVATPPPLAVLSASDARARVSTATAAHVVSAERSTQEHASPAAGSAILEQVREREVQRGSRFMKREAHEPSGPIDAASNMSPFKASITSASAKKKTLPSAPAMNASKTAAQQLAVPPPRPAAGRMTYNGTARPPTLDEVRATAKYRGAYRRVLSAIVAMPILLVTSYVLFDRLVLGTEQKQMPRPNQTRPETPKA